MPTALLSLGRGGKGENRNDEIENQRVFLMRFCYLYYYGILHS